MGTLWNAKLNEARDRCGWLLASTSTYSKRSATSRRVLAAITTVPGSANVCSRARPHPSSTFRQIKVRHSARSRRWQDKPMPGRASVRTSRHRQHCQAAAWQNARTSAGSHRRGGSETPRRRTRPAAHSAPSGRQLTPHSASPMAEVAWCTLLPELRRRRKIAARRSR